MAEQDKKEQKGLKRLGKAGGGFLKDFKTFISKGNVLHLAVAFIMGIAFNAIVQSLVNDIIMQFIAAIFGQADFSALSFDVNGTPIFYGRLIMALINFLLIAFTLFIIVKVVSKLQKGAEKLRAKQIAEGVAAPAPEKLEDIMKDIRELLKEDIKGKK